MSREIFHLIHSRILEKKKKDKALILGINGIETAGKTFFTLELNKYLESYGHLTQIIHIDDFQNPKLIRYASHDQIENYFIKSWNLQLLINELFNPIHAGVALSKSLTLLDILSDTLTQIKEYKITIDSIVLFEGVFLFRPELLKFIDYRIFLKIPFEEAKYRIALRDSEDIVKKIDIKYHPAQKQYIEHFKPEENADVVIDNTDLNKPLLIRS